MTESEQISLKPITANFPGKPAHELTFNNPFAAIDFVDREYSFWSWLFEAPEIQKHSLLAPVASPIHKTFARLRGAVRAWADQPTAADHAVNVSTYLTTLYTNLRLPLSTSPEAALIIQLRDSRGPTAAMAALAAYTGKLRLAPNLPELSNEILIGALALASIEKEAPNDTGLDEIRSLSQQIQSIYVEANEAKLRTLDTLKDLQERGLAQIASLETELKQRWETEFKDIWNRINEGTATLNATHEAFTKQMQLQASVSYWRQRSLDQKSFANKLLVVIIFYACGIVLIGATAAFFLIPMLISAPPADQPARYAIALTLTLLSASVVFWIGRVLVKLYLSAHHLSTDASERVVMIETFLALLKEGKLDDKDKTLVLTPLFTSPSDGLIKDDGAPDASVAGLISRFLDKR